MDNLSKEAASLPRAEAWIHNMATHVVNVLGIDIETATAGARWAALWRDDFTLLVEQKPPLGAEELREVVLMAEESSLKRTESVPRYLTGVPTLRSYAAVKLAFIASFGEEAGLMEKILETHKEQL